MAKCMTPFGVKKKTSNETITVPCGKCPACLNRRASGWSFRLMHEEKQSSSAHFITLTYDTKNVYITKNGFMSLNKRHVQLFFKRLRKKDNGSNRIKYYAAGEYGGKTLRPHYHIILFNASTKDIQDAWGQGAVHYGVVTGASIGYTLKYITKQRKIPIHRNDDREPEFSLMSKGLGKNYLTPKMVKWHKNDLDNRMYVNIEDGKKIAMPRYYKDKIYEENERKRVAFFARKKMVEDELKKQQDPDYWRNKSEADKAAFKKMYFNSKKGDKL